MVVDANVFKGYFQTAMGTTHSLCGCPMSLISAATPSKPIYHDVGRIIESEWQAVVDRDWFEPWLANQLMAGSISYIEPIKDSGLEKNLTSLGFPGGRDFVYVRVGMGVVSTYGAACVFITEDLDFYDPKKKGCPAKTRHTILTSSAGPVAKLLKRRKVDVSCVP